jgi:excisionase family DNA binding protein
MMTKFRFDPQKRISDFQQPKTSREILPMTTTEPITISAALPTVLTIHEAADLLKVSTRTMYSLTKPRGPIPCVRCGRRGIRYTAAALQQFIEQQESGG